MINRLIAFVVVFAVLVFPGCGKKDLLDIISDNLGIEIKSGEIITEYDDHGGLNGDGTAYYKIGFSDKDVQNEIEKDDNWEELPFPDTITGLISKMSGIMPEGTSKELLGLSGNGYYRIIDRHYKSGEGDILSRNSYNFTLGVFSKTENVLYYIKIDT